MTHFIQAVYEHGVFRPLEPVPLAEHERVSLAVASVGADVERLEMGDDDATIQRQRAALSELRSKMDALPSRAPLDGLGGADHDLILYGWQK